MTGNPFPVAIVMARDPVPVVIMSVNPFSVFVVVAINPSLAARSVGTYLNGCEDGQKGQTDTKNQQFHFQLLIPVWLDVIRVIYIILL
jgi:hypothetical protein